MDKITIFGEVLFDCFPDGEKILGGAPFNVAWHLQAFGQQPRFVSRVGEDDEGRVIRQAMGAWGMDESGLQRDPTHPTGQVQVRLQGGEPSYEIVDGVAYDFIDAESLAAGDCSILYHGSLSLRHTMPREALQRLRERDDPIIFMDVNLRAPWWQRQEVLEWVRQADWVKLNEEELASLQGQDGELRIRAEAFLRQNGLMGLVVTRGAEGATLLTRELAAINVAPNIAHQVVDTVGAGDALSSVLLLGLSQGWPMRETLERAQYFASAVVGLRGATTEERDFYRPFHTTWGLSWGAS
jgi:fructokinase